MHTQCNPNRDRSFNSLKKVLISDSYWESTTKTLANTHTDSSRYGIGALLVTIQNKAEKDLRKEKNTPHLKENTLSSHILLKNFGRTFLEDT